MAHVVVSRADAVCCFLCETVGVVPVLHSALTELYCAKCSERIVVERVILMRVWGRLEAEEVYYENALEENMYGPEAIATIVGYPVKREDLV